MNYGFGIDLGGTTVKLAFFQTDGTMLHKWEIPTDTSENGKRILPDIAAAVLDAFADYAYDYDKLGEDFETGTYTIKAGYQLADDDNDGFYTLVPVAGA